MTIAHIALATLVLALILGSGVGASMTLWNMMFRGPRANMYLAVSTPLGAICLVMAYIIDHNVAYAHDKGLWYGAALLALIASFGVGLGGNGVAHHESHRHN